MKDLNVEFNVSEGLPVLRAKLTNFTNAVIVAHNGNRANKDVVSFGDNVPIMLVTGHNASSQMPRQSSWVSLDNGTFQAQLRATWTRVKAAFRVPVSIQRDHPEQSEQMRNDWMATFRFQLYVFLDKNPRDAAGNRANQFTRAQAVDQINQHLRQPGAPQNVIPGGRVMAHWVDTQARNPSQPVTLPTDNTTRQLQYVDEHLVQMENVAVEANPETCVIDVEINGTWVQHRFKTSQLRRAVGLPDFPLVDLDLFRNNNSPLPRPLDSDRPDDDHMDHVGTSATRQG